MPVPDAETCLFHLMPRIIPRIVPRSMPRSTTSLDGSHTLSAVCNHRNTQVGRPEQHVLEAMEQEHTNWVDSSLPFTDPTYQLTTTSRIEWWFVVAPAEGLAKHIDLETEVALAR